ncbi:MAG: cobalamin biosynthesis protein CobD [Boseongicola sp. SB0677_bin_26]|nr:cobalamin biosynthesis protein CobD [Boseongicola sp. SB0665_bin_10]MYG24920.1 cobalamin biosynthesis protein CobD [Boseongicola sp. SB0677_bin_26]
MLIALALDVAIGWPDWLYRRIGHPVGWMGRAIAKADLRLNRSELRDAVRKRNGIAVALAVTAATGGLAWCVTLVLPDGLLGMAITGVLAWPFLAARSLDEHVRAVADPLADNDVSGAREAVSKIVGRDPAMLDSPAMARASLESLAENASDGVVAPLFWGTIFGLPGIAAYKAVNTLDSMIGHRTVRHEAFGWASARIDDLANLVPARLTAVLLACVSGALCRVLRNVFRDARRHRSPNAGWPEAAMAGALHVKLSGPRTYAGHAGPGGDPFLNPDGNDPGPEDIEAGIRLYRKAVLLAAVLLVLLAVL